MASKVVFISVLPPEIKELVKDYVIEISAYWTRDTVLCELFSYGDDEDFYEYMDRVEDPYPPKLSEFLVDVLDWRDTLPREEGYGVMDVIFAVADSYIASEDPSYDSQSTSDRRKIRDEWLESFLRTHTQPLPTEK